MNVIKLLEYLQDILETSNKVPMTGKVMVNRKEIIDIVNQIISELPEEFKKAQWILEEKESIISNALKEAEVVRQKNIMIMKKEIESHDITKEAKIRAEEILSSARKNAKEIRLGAREYASGVLNELDNEIKLKSNEMLSSIKAEMEKFIVNYELKINNNSDIIRENIKELRKI